MGTTVAKKVVVAVTGFGMVLFLIGHMLGNLQAFEGAEKLNGYAELLRIEPVLLWAIRLGLLAFVLAHVYATISLNIESRAARPVKYHTKKTLAATPASRTMLYGGIALFFYIVYHILHFTTRSVHTALVSSTYTTDGHVHPDVFANVVRSFQNPIISAVYIAAQIFLFFHLTHGVQSAFRTVGVTHPRYLAIAKTGGQILALVIVLGFIAVPVGVLAGIIE